MTRTDDKAMMPAAEPAILDRPGSEPTRAVPEPRNDLRVLRSLRRIFRAVEQYSRKLASEHHVTGPQLVCLLTVVEHGPLTGIEIARRIQLSASTVVGILDRLEDKGLVVRERDSKDRRRVGVTATPDGRMLAERAPSPLQEQLARALARLPEPEQTAIALSLERIVRLIEAEDIDASPMLETGPLDK